jgi:WASH complex subunit strumpellin
VLTKRIKNMPSQIDREQLKDYA